MGGYFPTCGQIVSKTTLPASPVHTHSVIMNIKCYDISFVTFKVMTHGGWAEGKQSSVPCWLLDKNCSVLSVSFKLVSCKQIMWAMMNVVQGLAAFNWIIQALFKTGNLMSPPTAYNRTRGCIRLFRCLKITS